MGSRLAGERGSNIEPQCAVMAAVKRECSDEQIARMMIVAVDERYGSPGHDDSIMPSCIVLGLIQGRPRGLMCSLPVQHLMKRYKPMMSS